MAYAFRDKSGWIIRFRPPWAKGTQRRTMRITPAMAPAGANLEAFARARAAECETVSRLLESEPSSAAYRQRALELGILQPDQAEQLRNDPTTPVQSSAPPAQPLTLIEAFRVHPSTIRTNHTQETARHEQLLERFVTWSRVATCHDLTLDLAIRWVKHLRDNLRWAPDSIRHALIGLRRASRIAGSRGLPDPLTGFQLLRNPRRSVDINAWTLEELCHGLAVLQAAGNHRIAAVLALGGLMGLRPSEIIRARVGDLQGSMLRVGLREAKNSDSCRTLPVPAPVLAILLPVTTGRDPAAPMIAARQGNGSKPSRLTDRPITTTAFSRCTGPLLASAIGSPGTIKTLRKSFASWAIEHVPTWVVEDYLGHRHSGVTAVTARHYLAKGKTQKLIPHAQRMAELITATQQALATASPKT